jgi:hypothetical protein
VARERKTMDQKLKNGQKVKWYGSTGTIVSLVTPAKYLVRLPGREREVYESELTPVEEKERNVPE